MPDPISWTHAGPYLFLALCAGYLIGSIPFGLLITRMAGLGDIRTIGSGNIGATNVLRTGHKGLAALTLLLDSGKGAFAALVAMAFLGRDPMLMTALGAVLGHNFPVWLKFKGGKGVATTLGTLIAVSWPVGLGACALWLIVAFITRYSSLAALIALGGAPIIAVYQVDTQIAEFSAMLALLAFLRHHENIRRLLHGTESKIGQKTVK